MRSKILLLTVSLFISFLLAEIGLRGIGYHPPLLIPKLYETGNPYRLKANFQSDHVNTDADGNRIVTNLRDPRTLLLGDSIVFGQGLKDSDTIASQLGIANIGVPGYSSWNEYERVKSHPHEIDRVILIYVPNDVTFENDHAGISQGGREVSQSAFHETTRFIYRHSYTAFLLSDGLKSLGNKSSFGIDWNALDYSMEAVEKIGKLKPLTVGIYRDVWYYHDPQAKIYEQRISEVLDRRGIKHFLIHSHIDHLSESEVKISWNDPHPSAKAVKLIARDILAFQQ